MNDSRPESRNFQQDAKADAKNVVDSIRGGVGQVANDAANHVRRAAEDVAESTELTLDQLKEQVVSLKADIAKLATSTAEASYEYVGSHVGDAMSSAERFTRERPAAAWGIAAGAGFLLAHLLSRR